MDYDYTVRKRQILYRKRMYEAGLKKHTLWIKRKEPVFAGKMTQKDFNRRVRRLTKGWDDDDLSLLFKLLIKIIIGKKEEKRIRER
jgi:CRISPR/Cas system-associated endoribonuclease Cas2